MVANWVEENEGVGEGFVICAIPRHLTYLGYIIVGQGRGAEFLQEFYLALHSLLRVVFLVCILEVVVPVLLLEQRVLGQDRVLGGIEKENGRNYCSQCGHPDISFTASDSSE